MTVAIARAPLRISLGGGGSDQPSYFERGGGRWVAGAIDKYVYVAVHESFDGRWKMRYSRQETVGSVDEIQHPILRRALRELWPGKPLEVTSFADVPAGTGLGSSGAFTVALLKALSGLRGDDVSGFDLAMSAYKVERTLAGMPVGLQDPFAAALGWVRNYSVNVEGRVTWESLPAPRGLMLFYTGLTRSANELLRYQEERSREGAMIREIDNARMQAVEATRAIRDHDMRKLAYLMDAHWREKRARPGVSSKRIDVIYQQAMESGAIGAKIVGAGGGGFLLAYTETPTKLRSAMNRIGAPELLFQFSSTGAESL